MARNNKLVKLLSADNLDWAGLVLALLFVWSVMLNVNVMAFQNQVNAPNSYALILGLMATAASGYRAGPICLVSAGPH